MVRDFSDVTRVVVKIGTNVLTLNDRLDESYIFSIAEEINAVRRERRDVLIVTSGAIGMGARELGLSGRVTGVRRRQACAAIGQPILMNTYKAAFARHGVSVAQVLLTREVLNNRKSFLNLKNSVEELIALGVVPIFNENDSVSTAEIGTAFGDNDQLSALIASKVDAGLLVMLSDVDALYESNPRTNANARRIESVETVTDEIIAAAGGAGTVHATGGMRTKISAVKIAEKAGCRVVIAAGREANILTRILRGESVGTVFLARPRLKSRIRWILNTVPSGKIAIDDGAIAALRRRSSLLPTGIRTVTGNFAAGDVVMLVDSMNSETAKIVTSFGSDELRRLIGRHSSEIAAILGPGRRDTIAPPEDIVFLE